MRSSDAHAVVCFGGICQGMQMRMTTQSICAPHKMLLSIIRNLAKCPPEHQSPRVFLFFLEIGSSGQTTCSLTKHKCCAFPPTSLP